MPHKYPCPWNQDQLDNMSEIMTSYFEIKHQDTLECIHKSLTLKYFKNVYNYKLSKKAFSNLVFRNRTNLFKHYKEYPYFRNAYNIHKCHNLPSELLDFISVNLSIDYQNNINHYCEYFEEFKPKGKPIINNRLIEDTEEKECPVNYSKIRKNEKYFHCETCKKNFKFNTKEFIEKDKKCPYCRSSFNRINIYKNC
jgi:hypothetical protein